MNTTAWDGYLDNIGDGFIYVYGEGRPNPSLRKTMPCGHSGLFLGDRWVCQTCGGYERVSQVHYGIKVRVPCGS